MSELEQQVARLKATHIQASSLHRGRSSLFLSPTDAAGIDMEIVYDAALSGLTTLSQYDGRFGEFSDGLLHRSAISLQRELKTKEVRLFWTVIVCKLMLHEIDFIRSAQASQTNFCFFALNLIFYVYRRTTH
jgi:hypothetical protein